MHYASSCIPRIIITVFPLRQAMSVSYKSSSSKLPSLSVLRLPLMLYEVSLVLIIITVVSFVCR